MYLPELDYSDECKIANSFKNKYKQQLITIKEKYENNYSKLVEDAKNHQAYRASLNNWKTNFELFLSTYYKLTGESSQEFENRIVANYIRHCLTSYDSDISTTLKEFWVSDSFFKNIWKTVMKEISNIFPTLISAYKNGIRAKEKYQEYKYLGYCTNPYIDFEVIEEHNEKEFQEIREWDDACERALEEAKQLERQEQYAERKQIAEISKSLVLKEIPKKMVLYYKGRCYTGEVIKVNKKTIKIKYNLLNGREFLKNINKVELYAFNKEYFNYSNDAMKWLKKSRPNFLNKEYNILN